jgi:hypothetical protein
MIMRTPIGLGTALLLTASLCLACSDDGTSDDGASGPETDGTDDEDEDEGEEGEGEGEGEGGEGDDQAGEEGGDVDNVAACESLLDALECGDVDLAQSVPCDQYGALACDLADYFTCLEDNFTCTDGVFDPSEWTTCAELATCS